MKKITYPNKKNLIYLGMEYELSICGRRSSFLNFLREKGVKTNEYCDDSYYYYEQFHKKCGYKVNMIPIGPDGGGIEFKFPAAPIFYAKRISKGFIKHYETLFPKERDTNGGGIHVHVSLKRNGNDKIFRGMHETEQMNYLVPIHRFLQDNCFLLEKVSGRPQNDPYNYFNGIKRRKSERTLPLSFGRSSGWSGLSSYGTFENRLFKAQPHLILPALEFTHSIMSLVIKNKGKTFTLEEYMKFLGNKKMYQNIKERIEYCK